MLPALHYRCKGSTFTKCDLKASTEASFWTSNLPEKHKNIYRLSSGGLDQLCRVIQGSWKLAQLLHKSFADLETPFNRVPHGTHRGTFTRGLYTSVAGVWSTCRHWVRVVPAACWIQAGVNKQSSSLPFADEGVLLAPSCQQLQNALGRFTAEGEVAGMRIRSSKSEAMVLDQFLGWRRVPASNGGVQVSWPIYESEEGLVAQNVTHFFRTYVI